MPQSVRLTGMTAIDTRLLGAPGYGPVPPSGRTRLERRAALDVSIDDELLRGELRGAALADSLRGTLAILVEHELSRSEPLDEHAFLSAGALAGLFAGARRRRRLEALIGMNFVRRTDGGLRPTVAGIAAIRPTSAQPASGRPSRELLRALRRAEIGGIRR